MPPSCPYCAGTCSFKHTSASDLLIGATKSKYTYFTCRTCQATFRPTFPGESFGELYPEEYGPYNTNTFSKKPIIEKDVLQEPTRPSTKTTSLVQSLPHNTRQKPYSRRARVTLQAVKLISKTEKLFASLLQKRLARGAKALGSRSIRKKLRIIYQTKLNNAQELFNHKDGDLYSLVLRYLSEGQSICDYGCGTHRFLARVSEMSPTLDLTAVDIVDHPNIPFAEHNIKFYRSDDFANISQKYNIIVLNHVLEHIPQPHDLLSDLRSYLADDGVIIFATPSASSIWSKIFKRYWFPLDCPRHLGIPTPKSINHLASTTGYKVNSIFKQYKYADFSRSILNYEASILKTTYRELVASKYQNPNLDKLSRVESKALSLIEDILRIHIWRILTSIFVHLGHSDRLLFVLSPVSGR